jgi:hypothetical protein
MTVKKKIVPKFKAVPKVGACVQVEKSLPIPVPVALESAWFQQPKL